MAGVTFIDELLEDQRDLTAAERFASWHEGPSHAEPAEHYHGLLPATPPRAGEQYAFEVDLDKCSGCKACVTACHSLNGLDDDESWRSVGLLVSPPVAGSRSGVAPVQQHVTTACHHCVDPGCLNGCPVLAYDKDPVTGAVRHLDDQCMGCSYCVMKCPYEVPRFSARLGIVRKCDLCSHRLAAGEAPACAQACPNEAIRITVVGQAEVRERYRTNDGRQTDPRGPSARAPHVATGGSSAARQNSFLPDSPDPGLTLPTTRYLSDRGPGVGVVAADHDSLRLDPAHGPLVLMLVLTQASAGVLVAATLIGLAGHARLVPMLAAGGLVLLGLGLAASVAHLGRPLKAWRSFLGWRRSWLSREIIAFTAFALLAAPAALAARLPSWGAWGLALTAAAAAAGVAGVFASSMVYVDTGRAFWGARNTFGNFIGTTALLGAAVAGAISAWMDWMGAEVRSEVTVCAAAVATAVRVALFVWRRLEMRRALADPENPLHWNARVIRDLLPRSVLWGTLLFVVSAVAGLLAIAGASPGASPGGHAAGVHAAVWAGISVASTFGAELIWRRVYFVAGGARRMPGGLPL